MNTFQTSPPTHLSYLKTQGGPPGLDCGRYDPFREQLRRKQFDTMRDAFQLCGGFVSGDEFTHKMRPEAEQSLFTVARWISRRNVLNILWRDQTLMPMFQFDLENKSIRPACADVIDELKAVFDDWELALWFATPNIWLDEAAPASVISNDRYAVVQAARADRFIARG